MIQKPATFIAKRVKTLLSLGKLWSRRNDSFHVLQLVRTKKLTFLGPGALADLALAVDDVERNTIPGIILEAGAALGGSSILIAATKNPQRTLQIYDTFEMIPAPTTEDGKDAHLRYETIKLGKAKGFEDDPYYGYQENLFEQVKSSFAESGFPVHQYNVQMIKGLIEDTMRIKDAVALAHIDCDWYSPVRACLEQIVPRLSPGGRIIIDDYNHWSGARKAVDEYFQQPIDNVELKNLSRLHIIRRN